jgi:hypothetical protein
MHEQMIHIISNFTWVTNIVFLGGLHWIISFSCTLEKKKKKKYNNNNNTRCLQWRWHNDCIEYSNQSNGCIQSPKTKATQELQLKWTAYHNCFEKNRRIQLG